jgi:hypothetical protein
MPERVEKLPPAGAAPAVRFGSEGGARHNRWIHMKYPALCGHFLDEADPAEDRERRGGAS